MTETAIDLRALAEQDPPVIAVDQAYRLVYDTDHPVRSVLRDMMHSAALQYANHLGVTAAELLDKAFGPSAYRAVFNRGDCRQPNCVHLDLLVVFDTAGEVLWYDRDDTGLRGSRLVAGRDEQEAYGQPLPVLEDDTKQAIEALVEKAIAAHEEYLPGTVLAVDRTADGRDLLYDGDLCEMDISGEAARLHRNTGAAAGDDSTGPQRRLLSPHERDVTVRVLRDLLLPEVLASPDVRIYSGDAEVLTEVARVLDPHEQGGDQPPDHQPGYINLAALEALLYQETAVIAEQDVPPLMDAIRTAARHAH
jgi:hypothetical protein